ncbi:MAG: flavodoxin family protein [Verrucomicrobiae bacterium]|nr:flavodoxin family protein [Verrucomicrobiae bacterium]
MKKLLVLSSSPRRDGNSIRLAESAAHGANEAGHQVELFQVDDHVSAFLRDCRQCRKEDGECGIEDGFRELFLDHYLPADGVIFATPLYWYGMSGQLKTFFDRTFCYYAASCPESAANIDGMSRKRIGLLISSEETYPGATLGVIHSIQEFSRYTHSEFVGAVQGIGNRRGDVEDDPEDPLARSERLGATIFNRHFSDYRIDSDRAGSVWTKGMG